MARHKEAYAGERFTEGLYLQLTPSQRAQLREAATAAGARQSDYAREQLFRRGGQPTIAAGVRRNPEAKMLADELRRIGNNLNQLSAHANARGELPEQREIQQTITLLKAALARVIAL